MNRQARRAGLGLERTIYAMCRTASIGCIAGLARKAVGLSSPMAKPTEQGWSAWELFLLASAVLGAAPASVLKSTSGLSVSDASPERKSLVSPPASRLARLALAALGAPGDMKVQVSADQVGAVIIVLDGAAATVDETGQSKWQRQSRSQNACMCGSGGADRCAASQSEIIRHSKCRTIVTYAKRRHCRKKWGWAHA